MKALIEKIKKMLKDNLPEGDCPSLLCALSGGKDSCCLLSALRELKETFGFSLYACHVDHKIRPPEETGNDRRVCLSLCEKLGVPLSVVSVDVPALCRENGKSVELCAREERYRVLEEERRKRGCDFIATAHTSTDSAETMLHNLLRGASGEGLCGIPPVRGRILRPLIGCTAEETAAWCAEKQIEYAEDSTNSDTSYTRNFIRLKIEPLLREINPSLEKNFASFAASMADDRAYFESVLPPFSPDRAFLASLPPAVLRRVLRERFRKTGTRDLSFDQLKAMQELILRGGEGEKTLDLPDGTVFSVERDRVSFREKEDRSFAPFPLRAGANPLPGGRMLFLGEDEKDRGRDLPTNINKLFIGIILKKDLPVDRIVVSARKGGERIVSGGMRRQVKKLLQAEKIPLFTRASLPVLSLEGETVWVPFLRQKDGTLPPEGENGLSLTYYYGG